MPDSPAQLGKPPLRSLPLTQPNGYLSSDWQRYELQHWRITTALVAAVGISVDLNIDPSAGTDSAPGINAAIQQLASADVGGKIYIPAGRYLLNSPLLFPVNAPPILFFGDGNGTVFLRGAALPASQGLFDVSGADVTFESFVVDGQITNSTPMDYATVAGNPMLAQLTANTSFWIHSNTARVRLSNITIRHTGGYAVLVDTANGLIENVEISSCLLENNRPFTFGTAAAGLNFGSWPGGIYVNGDGRVAGQNRVLRDFVVLGCTFRRNTGNNLWTHLLGLEELHENVRFIGNAFTDCGLDGILMGGISGGVVVGNTFRRIGYVCSDDTSRSVPRWLPNAQATGLDTSGTVQGVMYANNSFTSVNGACMDLDGFGSGVVSGNVCRCPKPGDSDYDDDQIAFSGPNNNGQESYGVNMGNTNNVPEAAVSVTISGNQFLNLHAGAIRMFAARDSHCVGNTIEAPADSAVAPIVVGNIGVGPNQRAQNNRIHHNHIIYQRPGAYAIVEDATTYAAPFSGFDVNYVYGNAPIIGGAIEFFKAASSGSTQYAETVWFP